MTLTTRHKGVLKAPGGASWEVIALTWFDEAGWGGFIEVMDGEESLRKKVSPEGSPFILELDDGRTGEIEVRFSEFIADGKPPLVFSGKGRLERKR